ncbi:MAG: hypothetical protein IJ375_01685, partial [Oscillospiraceae bacterium]|nr:hypothetical protein [Oscillospiraceae bacterium]
ERSVAESKNPRIYSHICGHDSAKILRLASLAQDDTVIVTIVLIKTDNNNLILSRRQGLVNEKAFPG